MNVRPMSLAPSSPLTSTVRGPSAVLFATAMTVASTEVSPAGSTTWWPVAFGSASGGLTVKWLFSMAVPPVKRSVTVRSAGRVVPLMICTVTVETFSASCVALSSSSSIDSGEAHSDSAGKSSSSVISTGKCGVGEQDPRSHVLPLGKATCTSPERKPGACSIIIVKCSEPS